MTPTERAWAAGFFDGEGTVYCARIAARPKYRAIRMAVAQSGIYGKRILSRFRRAIGGTGAIRGPYQQRERQAQYYRWDVSRPIHIEAIRKMLWPYLSIAKKQQFLRVMREKTN